MHKQKLYEIYKWSQTLNDCSTITIFPFLGQVCMRAKIGEFWLQTYIEVSFPYGILVIITHKTRKLLVVYGRSAYRMTALLSEMSIFYVRALCKIRSVSYELLLQTRIGASFRDAICMYLTRITWNYRSYVDVEHIQRLLYYRRHSLHTCGFI